MPRLPTINSCAESQYAFSYDNLTKHLPVLRNSHPSWDGRYLYISSLCFRTQCLSALSAFHVLFNQSFLSHWQLTSNHFLGGCSSVLMCDSAEIFILSPDLFFFFSLCIPEHTRVTHWLRWLCRSSRFWAWWHIIYIFNFHGHKISALTRIFPQMYNRHSIINLSLIALPTVYSESWMMTWIRSIQ